MAFPTSFDGLSNGIHRIRQFADKYTPGPSTSLSMLLPFMGGAAGAAVNGATSPDILNDHRGAFNAPPAPAPSVAPPISQSNYAAPAPYPSGTDPMSAGGPPPVTPAPQVATPPQPASTPMPQARPADAPAPIPTPDPMSFFQRNTAMMRDPVTGQFIDPRAASDAQVRGPDLINKMMSYLHNKDIG